MMSANIDDLPSILLAIFAVIYTIASLVRAANKERRPHPHSHERKERHEDEQEEPVRKKKPTPLPPAPVLRREKPKAADESYSFHSALEDHSQKNSIDSHHLEVKIKTGDELVSESLRLFQNEGSVGRKTTKPPIQQLINSLPQEKLLFLSYEVFHVPVCRRETPFPWNG